MLLSTNGRQVSQSLLRGVMEPWEQTELERTTPLNQINVLHFPEYRSTVFRPPTFQQPWNFTETSKFHFKPLTRLLLGKTQTEQ